MYPPPTPLVLALLSALAWAFAVAPAACRGDSAQSHAGPDASAPWRAEDDGHDLAREASERGEILPIAEVLERARARYPGRLLEAELGREHGRWVYELKILGPAGGLLEVYVDAQSGAVLGHEEDD